MYSKFFFFLLNIILLSSQIIGQEEKRVNEKPEDKKPPFLPDAPKPIVFDSNNATECPLSIKLSMVLIPAKPPPIIQFSVVIDVVRFDRIASRFCIR